jgi:hypothetical protein
MDVDNREGQTPVMPKVTQDNKSYKAERYQKQGEESRLPLIMKQTVWLL